MKVICTQENLRSGLQAVSRIVGSSSTLPILNNILLQTENGQLKISATNLEIGISTFIRCKIEQEGGVCLNAKTAAELVNNLPNENITIEVGEIETSVSTDRYHTKIKQLPVEDFPLIPKLNEGLDVMVPAEQLKNGFEQVMFAASTSETQPEISGIMTKFGSDGTTFVATDRYRLAEKTIPLTVTLDKRIIIPQKSVLELTRLLGGVTGEVQVQVSDTQLSVTMGDTYVVTRLIDGQYPDYQQIIPDETGTVVVLDKAQLVSALKTSGIFSRGVGSVTMVYDSEKQVVQIASVSQDVGESVVDIPAEIEGETGSVIMNYRYVLDVLQSMTTDALTIQVINDTSPVVFKQRNEQDYLYLVMPIRI